MLVCSLQNINYYRELLQLMQ